MISGTEFRPGRRRSPGHRSQSRIRGSRKCRPCRLREPVGHGVEVEAAADSGSTQTVVELLTIPFGELASGFDIGDHTDRAVAPRDLSGAGQLFLQRTEHTDALRIDNPTSGLVRTLERDAIRVESTRITLSAASAS